MDSSPPVVVRFATDADLTALEWEGQYVHYRRLFKKAVAEARRGRRLLLLAEVEGQIVGQVFVQLSTRLAFSASGCSSGYLYAFRVKEPHRNQGIGTQLIREAESRLRRLGYDRVVISVATRNTAARRLYERLDYRIFSEDPGEWSYVDHLGQVREVREPAFVLEKWL
ncbi:MAG TPA: GNAT family N-acetyltransferase [Anaerolineales bacterium]